jgi:hypothetical protein
MKKILIVAGTLAVVLGAGAPLRAELLKVDMDTIDIINDAAGINLVDTSTFLVMGAFKTKDLNGLRSMFGGYTSATQVADAFTVAGGFSIFDTAAWSEEGLDFTVNFAGDHTTVLTNYTTDSSGTLTYPIVLGIFKQSSLPEFSSAGSAAEYAVIRWDNNSFPRGGQSAEGVAVSLPFDYAASSGKYDIVVGSWSSGALALQPIPEPSSFTLVGMTAWLCLVRQRKSSTKS